jgi:hypothetical protein
VKSPERPHLQAVFLFCENRNAGEAGDGYQCSGRVGSDADGVRRSRTFREVGSLVYPRARWVRSDEKRCSVLEIVLYVIFAFRTHRDLAVRCSHSIRLFFGDQPATNDVLQQFVRARRSFLAWRSKRLARWPAVGIDS